MFVEYLVIPCFPEQTSILGNWRLSTVRRIHCLPTGILKSVKSFDHITRHNFHEPQKFIKYP